MLAYVPALAPYSRRSCSVGDLVRSQDGHVTGHDFHRAFGARLDDDDISCYPMKKCKSSTSIAQTEECALGEDRRFAVEPASNNAFGLFDADTPGACGAQRSYTLARVHQPIQSRLKHASSSNALSYQSGLSSSPLPPPIASSANASTSGRASTSFPAARTYPDEPTISNADLIGAFGILTADQWAVLHSAITGCSPPPNPTPAADAVTAAPAAAAGHRAHAPIVRDRGRGLSPGVAPAAQRAGNPAAAGTSGTGTKIAPRITETAPAGVSGGDAGPSAAAAGDERVSGGSGSSISSLLATVHSGVAAVYDSTDDNALAGQQAGGGWLYGSGGGRSGGGGGLSESRPTSFSRAKALLSSSAPVSIAAAVDGAASGGHHTGHYPSSTATTTTTDYRHHYQHQQHQHQPQQPLSRGSQPLYSQHQHQHQPQQPLSRGSQPLYSQQQHQQEDQYDYDYNPHPPQQPLQQRSHQYQRWQQHLHDHHQHLQEAQYPQHPPHPQHSQYDTGLGLRHAHHFSRSPSSLGSAPGSPAAGVPAAAAAAPALAAQQHQQHPQPSSGGGGGGGLPNAERPRPGRGLHALFHRKPDVQRTAGYSRSQPAPRHMGLGSMGGNGGGPDMGGHESGEAAAAGGSQPIPAPQRAMPHQLHARHYHMKHHQQQQPQEYYPHAQQPNNRHHSRHLHLNDQQHYSLLSRSAGPSAALAQLSSSYMTYGYRRACSSLAALDPPSGGGLDSSLIQHTDELGYGSSSDDDTEETTRRITAAFRNNNSMTRASAWGLLGEDPTPTTPTSEAARRDPWVTQNSGLSSVTGDGGEGGEGKDRDGDCDDSGLVPLTRKRSSYHLTNSHAAVELFLRLNHARQTVDFAKRQAQMFGRLDKAEMSVWEALHALNELREYEAVLMLEPGEAQQEVAELSLLEHAFQTAELCRLHHPELDWLHLVGLMHGLGKLLAHSRFGSQPQWAICGESYPLGCRFSPHILGAQYFTANPDRRRRLYNTPTGMYGPGCGLSGVTMSWCGSEYLHLVLRLNQVALPEDAMWVLRHSKFLTLTRPQSCYLPLCAPEDLARLPLLRSFQALSAFRRAELPEGFALRGEQLTGYYEGLIAKYIGLGRLRW
ncbi:hypothetical protein Agub_g413 [Astrephomene gubernaculifera]|uniref:Inositol oxygenase n=1 Tax=Astrephomene gubernaculifera TaxID=47775 RepID=A0AAD3DFV4_9CHLO|nr:hypothetical protein Agub_g413 [Astrephomene gubernaculifera]